MSDALTPELEKRARECVAHTKSAHLTGIVIPPDEMLTFALADACLRQAAEIEGLRDRVAGYETELASWRRTAEKLEAQRAEAASEIERQREALSSALFFDPMNPMLPEALIKLGLSAKDKLQGVTPIIVRRALDGEKPNFYVGFGESEWNGGVVFSDQRGAAWASAENWTCVREIQSEIGNLKRQINAAHIPHRDYDGAFVMRTDDEICDADDYLRDDDRCWAWAAEEEPFHWHPIEALEDHFADWFDEANTIIPDADLAPLHEAWAAIEKKHGPSLSRYSEDQKRLVVYNEAQFAKELVEWGERLVLCEAAIARIRLEGAPATHLLHVTHLVARIAKRIKPRYGY